MKVLCLLLIMVIVSSATAASGTFKGGKGSVEVHANNKRQMFYGYKKHHHHAGTGWIMGTLKHGIHAIWKHHMMKSHGDPDTENNQMWQTEHSERRHNPMRSKMHSAGRHNPMRAMGHHGRGYGHPHGTMAYSQMRYDPMSAMEHSDGRYDPAKVMVYYERRFNPINTHMRQMGERRRWGSRTHMHSRRPMDNKMRMRHIKMSPNGIMFTYYK